METAVYKSRVISALEGVDIRDRLGRGGAHFQCVECDKPAKVMRDGKGGKPAAHFEHLERNSHCSLVHRTR